MIRIQRMARAIAKLKSFALVPVPVPEFHQFSKLPLELRLKIWRASFQEEEVNLHEEFGTNLAMCRMDIYSFLPYSPRIKRIPVTALVNQESRNETLRHYIRLFQNVERPHDVLPAVPNTVYFNPDVDTLFLTSCSFRRLWIELPVAYIDTVFPPYDPTALSYRNKVRSLEIYTGTQKSIRRRGSRRPRLQEEDIFKFFSRFPNLQEIVLVFRRELASSVRTHLIAETKKVFELENRSLQIQTQYADKKMPMITSRENDYVGNSPPPGVKLSEYKNY